MVSLLWSGKRGELSHSSDEIDACTCIKSVCLHVNMCGSAQCCRCVVNGYGSLLSILIIIAIGHCHFLVAFLLDSYAHNYYGSG